MLPDIGVISIIESADFYTDSTDIYLYSTILEEFVESIMQIYYIDEFSDKHEENLDCVVPEYLYKENF